ncbi:tryptophan-rich sensory protein [Aureimonas leprariae]|uniref:Tryptophan-rich sensory protein n=1 Tax=Plantimonas leprariae TaxID=2615207 RepID=A0A7V7PQK9_9HYPH|nr:tryptophan-rich sensory protein [Aureimonas leprariae]
MDWTLAVFGLLGFAAATSGGFFRPGEWYERLRKPSWTPPNWAFGAVWSVLYVMIVIAGWLVWRNEPGGPAVWLWGIQLVLNALWSAIFFGMRRIDLAMAEVLLLWLAIAAFIVAAAGISATAAILFVPYLIWVTIAAALNWGVLRMNAAAP